MLKKLVCGAAFIALTCAATLPKFSVTADVQSALDRISADSLRGNLSFLASDVLEGRDTPSRGLDIAAEFIASQFRKAGLDPAGNDGYFQDAKMLLRMPNPDGFELILSRGGKEFAAVAKDVKIRAATGLNLTNVAVIKADAADEQALESLTPDQVNNRVVILELARGRQRSMRSALRRLREAKPVAMILVDRGGTGPAESSGAQLVDPDNPERTPTPRITLQGVEAGKFYDSLRPGASGALASIHLAQPSEKAVQLRNVIGLLPGSDPALKDSYVMVTAHYDHIGEKPSGEGDRIYNGANDDGSGTVSVIELANALSKLKERPRRSIVFMTVFGEEKGLVGSRYYAHHPLFPIAKTVADMNLEQVGRTDSSEGPQVATAFLTGVDYTNLTDYFQNAAELTGIKIGKNKRDSELYFQASDNYSFAEAGVPAQTLSVAFQFPDYHGLGDEWNKIDYDNMAKVDRMAALAVFLVANHPEPPRWNESNPRTAPFRK